MTNSHASPYSLHLISQAGLRGSIKLKKASKLFHHDWDDDSPSEGLQALAGLVQSITVTVPCKHVLLNKLYTSDTDNQPNTYHCEPAASILVKSIQVLLVCSLTHWSCSIDSYFSRTFHKVAFFLMKIWLSRSSGLQIICWIF